ncbi:MAG: kinase/pyrophosphorylase [Anaerolineae bacterium]|jgi:regulator of PEP synthase PpsR (kinase-PPPase family)|nr:kinase/pyrophosphorylase [Anaerolineae bacterium]MDH7473660.1 pyruvate, water dikinase regulatory protein [Anaerolineae bacterium]
MKDAGVQYIFVVSDATGTTAEMVLRAALTQFEAATVEIQRVPNVRSEEQVRDVVQRAAQLHGLIVHTLVSAELRQVMLEEGRRFKVDTIDLMGPLLTRLTTSLNISPLARPGLFRQLDEDYFRRVEAVDFTVKHDDGRNIETLEEADIVLTGVSRTSKTPLSMYLSFYGWRVANVPIVLDVEPPRQLLQLPPGRVVALTIDPDRLYDIRYARLQRIARGLPAGYIDPVTIRDEIRYAGRIFHAQGWPVVDVTRKSLEEIASEVISLSVRRKKP